MIHLRILLFVVLPTALWCQTKAQDCYIHYMHSGTVAQQRGDYSKALSHYREGLKCPEVQQSGRRSADLKANIAQCEAALTPNKRNVKRQNTFAPVEGLKERKRFMLSAAFLRDTSKDCFSVTFQEAERAYRGGFWDDAAALYRAAKNCSDATQERRLQVSDRITDCRNSAEDELRMKELEALRRTRHAVASNMADDALKLMDDGDKTTGFRLADFANRYVAPDDNPDCVQALFDIKDANSKFFFGSVPFCYHLGKVSNQVEIGFLQSKTGQELYALDILNSKLAHWSGDQLIAQPLINIPSDGNTSRLRSGQEYKSFLIGSDKGTMLWRNTKDIVKLNIKLPEIYCFSEDQSELYFFSDKEKALLSLTLKSVSRSKKDNTLEQSRYVPRPVLPEINAPIWSLQFYKGQLWVSFSDHVEIWSQNVNRRAWGLVRTIKYHQNFENLSTINLKPAHNLLIASGDSTYFMWLSGDSISHTQAFDFQEMALSNDGSLVAYIKVGLQHINHLDGVDLIIQNTRDLQVRYRSAIPSSELDGSSIKQCVFSQDASWLAMSTVDGNIMAWDLGSLEGQIESDTVYNIPINSASLSPDGKRYIIFQDSLIRMVSTKEHPETIPDIVVKGISEQKCKAISNNWVSWQYSMDSLVLSNLSNGERLMYAINTKQAPVQVDIDPSEKYIAYTIGKDSVIVRALQTGAIIATKGFGGGIFSLKLTTNAQKLIVQIEKTAGLNESGNKTAVKVWNLQERYGVPKSLGLRNYDANQWVVSPNGRLIALANIEGSEIHLFDLDSLGDELPPLRGMKQKTINSFVFSPDNASLAVAFQLGDVTIFDVKTGQVKLALAPDIALAGITQLCFMEEGRKLRSIGSNSRYYSRDLDPDNVTKLKQTNTRQLSAFSADQISEYVLDEALDYGNNFDRLAESGDKPLILSFFQYYSKQATGSNNINLVSQYCERAYELYLRLKSPIALLPALSLMYRDYAWKCLLRGDIRKGGLLADFLKNNLSDPTDARFLQANIALLRNDYSGVTKQYTDLLMNHTEANAYWITMRIDSLFNQARELYEYDLLNADDLGCMCSILGDLKANSSFCNKIKRTTQTAQYLSPKEQQRWTIFKRYAVASDYTIPTREKQKLLRQNVRELEALVRQQPNYWTADYENNLLELAALYFSMGAMESNSKYAILNYDTAILLLKSKAFTAKNLISYANTISLTRIAYGDALTLKDQHKEAINQYDLGLKELELAYDQVMRDSSKKTGIGYSFAFSLLEKKGMALLFEKNTNDAQLSFEKALEMSDALSDIYFGYIDLIENREAQAIERFQQIYSPDQLASIMFTIRRLSQQYPESKGRMMAFEQKLRDSMQQNIALSGDWMMPFALSEQKRIYEQANNQYEAAFKTNQVVYLRLDSLMAASIKDSNMNYDLFANWNSSVLNHSFLSLFLHWNHPAQLEEILIRMDNARTIIEKSGVFLPEPEQLLTNIGHAQFLLGRREQAIKTYKEYMGTEVVTAFFKFNVLFKDFRDLHAYGVKWPDLKIIVEAIVPKGYDLTATEWRQLGL